MKWGALKSSEKSQICAVHYPNVVGALEFNLRFYLFVDKLKSMFERNSIIHDKTAVIKIIRVTDSTSPEGTSAS